MNNEKLISKEKISSYFETIAKIAIDAKVTGISADTIDLSDGISQLMNLALTTHKRGKKLIFIGNGGSSAIASHMATDYSKNGGLSAICFSDASLLTCLSNDYGYEHVYEKPIEMFAQPEDLLIAISSSGKSPNILQAVKAARSKKCQVVTFSGFNPDNPLRRLGDINFYVSSEAYGYVEITHLSLCHAVLDFICELKEKKRVK